MTAKTKLTILLLSWEYPPQIIGGLAHHVQGLATGLMNHEDCEVFVITANRGNHLEYERENGVHVYRVRPLNDQEPNFLTWIAGLNMAMMEKAFQLARQHRFMVIHAHDWLVGAAAIMLKGTWKIPLIVTIHSTEFGRNNGIFTQSQSFIHSKEKQLITAAQQIIVCSPYMKKEVRKTFSIPANAIKIIANGVTLPEKQGVNQADFCGLPIQAGKRLIFTLGRMVPEKGFATLIEAAPKLIEKYHDLYFIIGGIGPMMTNLQELVNAKGLSEHVFLVGYLDEAKKKILFNQCELAIFPSLYEPFGIVALEAMSYGKPTIVAKTGGLASIIEHGQTGLFIIPGEPESIIEQVEFVLEHSAIAALLGQNAQKKVQRTYNWRKIATETKHLYIAALANITIDE